ncbi:DNA-directed RNA polymerase sigma-70 factor [Sphingobacterium mizutaii NBRC 14946 = DSM 11724]|uniref:RNA polymerase sigma factor n=2 Tax=Sphingobacterium mizutaii TaxID=1010 RepID=A0AAJ5C1R2_9SPHI|nr:sigma-70 family RNA polymerase sigma factor [Sphingobacterium mizutaii]GEM69904.1 DNA-directed RNA polymerase sigma-70 factor [Sphingobacterium mizutaii NBRC 14946 = DSM 11724]SDL87911.1 RNA polymerase sigma-70 factor, ECF subfamily [Sphingobacterium mizutaii]SNV58878.1 RNA polymerase sigma factor [Sphingobacterium mizutaii]
MDEKQLLQYYKETGSLDALGKLYAPYMSLLYGVCYKYLQDAEQSQDAVMQIFDELINKLRVYEVDNFKSWVYVYARNFCLMQLRKNKQITKVDIEENLYESEKMLNDDDEKKWGEQDFEKLESCIAGLNQEQELCIRMFYLEQKCYKDIADQTGYDIAKVKSYIQNGRRNLKICMEKK